MSETHSLTILDKVRALIDHFKQQTGSLPTKVTLRPEDRAELHAMGYYLAQVFGCDEPPKILGIPFVIGDRTSVS